MASYNKVILMGNLTREPELRQTQSGTSVMNCAVAVNEKFLGANGEKKETVFFADISSFGRLAENIARYFHKGDAILVEGRLRLESWTDKQSGQTRSKLSVLVERFEFVGGKRGDAGEAQKQRQNPTRGFDDAEDDVDF